MHAPGHVGAALLFYTPTAAFLMPVDPALAVVGFGVAAAVSTLPDVDQQLPVPHRGPTHTLWFVLAATVAAGLLTGVIAGSSTAVAGIGLAVCLSLSSHLLADSITPMGIRPFAPLSRRRYTADLTPAANRSANAALFAVGTAVAALSLIFRF
ncbi:MAG: metal-dependent hydrolase [Natronomonas sp.]